MEIVVRSAVKVGWGVMAAQVVPVFHRETLYGKVGKILLKRSRKSEAGAVMRGVKTPVLTDGVCRSKER